MNKEIISIKGGLNKIESIKVDRDFVVSSISLGLTIIFSFILRISGMDLENVLGVGLLTKVILSYVIPHLNRKYNIFRIDEQGNYLFLNK